MNLKIVHKRYKDFLRFGVFLLPYWKMAAATMTLSYIIMLLSLATPYLTKLVIDNAFANRDLALFVRLAVLGAIIFIITAVAQGLNDYLEEKVNLGVNFDMNSMVFRHIQKLPLSFFRDKTTGEHIFKLNSDLNSVSGMVTRNITQILLITLRFLFILIIVLYLNLKMALLCLIASPIIYFEYYFYSPKRRDIFKKQIELSQSILERLAEVFSHIYLVKAFGKEDFEINDFLKRLFESLKLSLRAVKLEIYSAFTGSGLSRVVIGTISLYGGYQVIRGQISLGSLTAIMIYLRQLIDLQISIGDFLGNLRLRFVSCDRINEILERQPDIIDSPSAKTISLAGIDIEFNEVTFGYATFAPVLNNLSFSIKGGSTVAIIGHSGCGKTTMINLLLRLYEPQKGKVLIGSDDLRDIKMDCLKEQMGIALQEPFLWNDTIENNIRYANQNASFAQIVEAAQLSGADNFIRRLPDGYKAHLGENAALISEGQKQRIAIARAIIRNPEIIILDEAMSSLDSESEDRIIDNIKIKFKSATIIIVSHRLSAVKKMDLLYFLQAPDKIEVARHEEFMEHNKKYRELFSSQIDAERSYKV